MTYVIIFALVMGVGLIFTIFIMNKQKQAEVDINLDQWRANGAAIQQEMLDKQAPFLKDWMKDLPIDAFTSAALPSNLGDLVKEYIKTSVRKAYTFGTLAATETPAYFVLSKNELHFFNSKPDGSIAEHLVFTAEQIQNATIEYAGGKKEMGLDVSKFMGKDQLPQAYNLKINDAEYDYILQAIDRLIIHTSEGGLTDMFSANAQNNVKGRLVGERFFKQLATTFPHLLTNVHHELKT